jgi:predicted transposase YbfD/YdcC
VISAFAHEAGLVIGQRCVDQKSNEITAIPLFLADLAIKGAIVTIDAMGTQKAIASAIIEKKCDYVLALKGNQGTLQDDVRLFFETPDTARDAKAHTTLDIGHGRIETRTCRVVEDINWLTDAHPDRAGLRTICAVTAARNDKKQVKPRKKHAFI